MNSNEPLVCEAPAGWALGCRRTGAAHLRAGKPCQDAFAIRLGSAEAPGLAVAVADGHGDERHDLSQFGAELAVAAAVEELLTIHSHSGRPVASGSLKNSFRTDFPRRVHRRWRELVLDHGRRRLSMAGEVVEERIFSRYGSTLLAALVTDDAYLLGQIGDGEILLVRPGGAVERPLPRDAALVGSQTTSLSAPDAYNLWQTACLERGAGGFLLLTTDGLANAFTDEAQFARFARSLTERVRDYGRAGVAEALPGWLDHYSADGCGDDVTLALVEVR
jgi:serine/threonine protein phosphatase PrpC